MTYARGVTLLELLVSVAIIAALATIGIITLRHVKMAERDVQDLSNLRQSMTDVFAWSAANDGKIVNAGLPWDRESDWMLGADSSPEMRIELYRSQIVQWPRILRRWSGDSSPVWHSVYGPLSANNPEFDASHFQIDPGLYSSLFQMSMTMITDTKCWTYPGPGYGSTIEFAKHYSIVRIAQIEHPGAKWFLMRREPNNAYSFKWLVALADGSANERSRSGALPAAAWPTGPPDMRSTPVTATVNGHAGLDF